MHPIVYPLGVAAAAAAAWLAFRGSGSKPAPAIGPGYVPTAPPSPAVLAQRVAQNLTRGSSGYDSNLLRQFQASTGLPGSGLYDAPTKAALESYGVAGLPPPFVKGEGGENEELKTTLAIVTAATPLATAVTERLFDFLESDDDEDEEA